MLRRQPIEGKLSLALSGGAAAKPRERAERTMIAGSERADDLHEQSCDIAKQGQAHQKQTLRKAIRNNGEQKLQVQEMSALTHGKVLRRLWFPKVLDQRLVHHLHVARRVQRFNNE